jgi:hypothetical protein
VIVEVMFGTRSPIRILAFSRLRARMRGLASRLTSASVWLARMIVGPTVAPMVEELRLRRSFRVSPSSGSGRRAMASGQLIPQRLQARALDFEDLDFEHHLGFGDVLQGDQLVGQADRFEAVADHQQVELLVDHDVLGLEDRLERGADGLGIRIREIEGLDHQRLVVLLLGRCVRVDQDRVAIEHALFELVGEQQDVDRGLDGAVAQEDGGLLIGAQSLSKTKLSPAVREITSKTVFSGVSLNSMVIGLRNAADNADALAILAVFSSISRCSASARSCLGSRRGSRAAGPGRRPRPASPRRLRLPGTGCRAGGRCRSGAGRPAPAHCPGCSASTRR